MWLICELEFNGRKQEIMHPKRYTQLFFLDEAVALAAGHRPCGECRRKSYRAYIQAVNAEYGNLISGATQLDRELLASRRGPHTTGAIESLPNGVFVKLGYNDFRLVWDGVLYKWSAAAYVDPIAIADATDGEVTVLTPALSVAALRHGYPVAVHQSIGTRSSEKRPPVARPEVRGAASTPVEGSRMNELTPELRTEIEAILRTSSPGLTHGELFRYMEQGLNEEEMVVSHGTGLSNVRAFLKSLNHLLEGTLPEGKSAARVNSMVYKELLNHNLSQQLLSYVKRQLQRLMAVNPEINMDPLRTRRYQYPAKNVRQAAPNPICPTCHLAHAGECD